MTQVFAAIIKTYLEDAEPEEEATDVVNNNWAWEIKESSTKACPLRCQTQ